MCGCTMRKMCVPNADQHHTEAASKLNPNVTKKAPRRMNIAHPRPLIKRSGLAAATEHATRMYEKGLGAR